MKKKVLLSSILTIALCLSLIAGSTFALFTSSTEVNIAVTAGEVDMLAGVKIVSVESVLPDANGTIADENNALYSYLHWDDAAPYEFVNGGTAVLNGAVVTLDRVTPGDKINLEISGANNSDVAVKYRYVIECIDGYQLMSGFNVYINNVKYEKLASFTSPYATLTPGSDMAVVPVTIELPVEAGNEYQKKSTEIRIVVEAVQGNAVVADNVDPIIVNIDKATTVAEAQTALANAQDGDVVLLTDGEYGDIEITNSLKDVTIVATPDMNARFKIKSGASLENVTFEGLDLEGDGFASYDGVVSIEDGAAADLTFKDCTFAPNAGYSSVRSYDSGAKLEFIDCTFESGRYAAYKSGAPISELVYTNCEFNNITSWIYQSHDGSTASAVTLVVDGCTFNNCTGGLFKCSGSYAAGSVITFTNNVIADDCTGHDGLSTKWFELNGANCTVTVSGNKLGTADWTPSAAEGLNY